MTLTERIDAAIERIASGHGPMRIPADPTDPDLVLAECQTRLTEVERERDDWKSATLECDCDYGCGCFERHCSTEKPCMRHALVAGLEHQKQRADRAEADFAAADEHVVAALSLLSEVGAEGHDVQGDVHVGIYSLVEQRDAALAAVAQLRGVLESAETGLRQASDPDEGWRQQRDVVCARATAALASTTLGAGWVSPERLRELMERAWDEGVACRDDYGATPSDFVREQTIEALLAEVAK